ncbi:hypothetical protein L284_20820 [Novosphingobium lindaniclasticum LE124]|uniref:Uncharacterized protein n=1 Tax=Novosphingobium lindaniclasticum LE124 TaxID=1096930 RepID=T0IGL8_9SPHN|nr:hypothetical protein L284_20820 [Novosphingobium lindaniclasticum LE124]
MGGAGSAALGYLAAAVNLLYVGKREYLIEKKSESACASNAPLR